MKKLLLILLPGFALLACKKEDTVTPPVQTTAKLTDTSVVTMSRDDQQKYVRAWTEWTYGRDVAVSPVSDPTGTRQAVDQPYDKGVFLLAGSSNETLSPPLVKREITLNLNTYQYVLLPLVNLSVWYDECDPTFGPAANQTPEQFFQPFMTDAFGENNNNLSLILDNTTVSAATLATDYRAGSGVWRFTLHPTQNYNCTTAPFSTIVTDGYWALIKLIKGDHTIESSGSFKLESYFDYTASSRINYTIHVQ